MRLERRDGKLAIGRCQSLHGVQSHPQWPGIQGVTLPEPIVVRVALMLAPRLIVVGTELERHSQGITDIHCRKRL
jgi:hypothetical protein